MGAMGESTEQQGRITVFSISGCPHCRTAKALLKQKGAHYVEINMDVYPERRAEMERMAKRSSAPQIFFNDEHIGGNDDLQALNASGALDAKLKEVAKTSAPPTAPAPPSRDEQVADNTKEPVKQDQMAKLAEQLMQSVMLRSHGPLQSKKNTVTGAEVVSFLAKDQKCSRAEALDLGNMILKKHFIVAVQREQVLKDGPALYRFLEHEPALQKKNVLNFTGNVSSTEPEAAPVVGDKLRKLILAIYDEFLSEDGRSVDYHGIAGSESFKRYVKLTETLQRLDLKSLTRDEKLAFLINVYNALVIHATAVLGHGASNAKERSQFFGGYSYLIGGQIYSLSEIENGLLRGNRRPPYALHKPFSSSDRRAEVALVPNEPLIHFALVCGAKSCPPIKTYKAQGVYEQLQAAARSFFESGGLDIDEQKSTISLSKILYWYHVDFGKSDEEMLNFIRQFLNEDTKAKLQGMLKRARWKVIYQPYDWSANSNH